MFVRHLQAVSGVGINHQRVLVPGRADGVDAVRVRALATDKTVAGGGLRKRRVGAQVKLASSGQAFAKQCLHARAIAAQQVKHKTFEVGGLRNVHRWTGGLVRIGTGANAVNAGAEELIQHIILIGGDHQFVDRQAHHARHMAGAHISEVAGWHGEAD